MGVEKACGGLKGLEAKHRMSWGSGGLGRARAGGPGPMLGLQGPPAPLK